jgi:dTDP-4-amino-4,6-dideoxygalactose transaminase
MDSARIYANFGPLSAEVERRYAERFNVSPDRVATCSSATMALEGAVFLSPAERIYCPAWTFPATALAIINAHKAISFQDVRRHDWQIEPPNRRPGDALMVVLPFGADLDLSQWSEWPEVVIDAAASGGSANRDLSGLGEGWAVVVSLHATKVLGAGEGGVVVFGDPERAELFRAFTSFGFQDRRESDFRSTNAKMPEAIAAYALAALDDWEHEEAEWRAARSLVAPAESALGIETVCSSFRGVSPYWIARFRDATVLRNAEAALHASSISTRRWWPTSCTKMGAFEGQWSEMATPMTDELAETTLGLPFYRGLSRDDVDRVVSVLGPVVAETR